MKKFLTFIFMALVGFASIYARDYVTFVNKTNKTIIVEADELRINTKDPVLVELFGDKLKDADFRRFELVYESFKEMLNGHEEFSIVFKDFKGQLWRELKPGEKWDMSEDWVKFGPEDDPNSYSYDYYSVLNDTVDYWINASFTKKVSKNGSITYEIREKK